MRNLAEMHEKEPQSAKKCVCSQSDRLRKVRSEQSDPSPSLLSLSVSVFLIPPAGPVFLFFLSWQFLPLPQKQLSAKMTSLVLEATRPLPNLKGRGGGLVDKNEEKAKVNKCRWSRCSCSMLVDKMAIHFTSRAR